LKGGEIKMIEKLKLIFNSVRFWGFTLSEAGLFFREIALNGFTWEKLLLLVSAILLTAATIGTVDKWFSNFKK